MDEWFTKPDTLLTKAQELYFRAQAHPGDPAIAQEIQDFTIATCLAWQPMYDRLCAIIEQQSSTIRKQNGQIDSILEGNDRLIACLQRFQAFRTDPFDALSLVPHTGA